MRELLDRPGAEIDFERRTVAVEWESAGSWVSHCEEVLGPTVMAKAALEPEGRWDAARADLVALHERFDEAGDGTLRARAEYLLTTVRLP